MRLPLAAALLAAAVVLAACGEDGSEGPTMKPGQDCLGCHGNFAAAGTVSRAAGVSGLNVAITVGGVVQTATTNAVGNFYVGGTGAVSDATINGRTMSSFTGQTPTGHCNTCHHVGGVVIP